ncbi:threonine deaminase [Thermoplasma volcanium GSS1]|uniref:threonine ammonia-lyase n=1 Tax=Thermoplasma volcanium (strain ATCC 51530 / DSM 4299 / JCM 9571 / NBRC 15438 / GSS1) TaxID=273116 RepID=Q97CB2_THEVO|nr:threonine ammonia-lyase [Thermoplasma volcanium]BAB59332.1 threonine deaminase [Thermoplasma volcanium GSS1]
MENLEIPSFDEIIEAQRYLEGKVNRTPLIRSTTIGKEYGADIYFKLENFQKTGSFKSRGAIFRFSKLSEDEKRHGVITASAGNHAQGVAYAAMINGIDAKIVMPEYTIPQKVNAVISYGAHVILKGSDYDEAHRYADEIAKQEGRIFIEAFNDRWVISGQGTIGLEIMEDLPDVDIILVPVGGGGLISGIALAAKHASNKVKVIGIESELSDSMKASLREGKIVAHTSGVSICDGISVKYPGVLTFDIARKYVDDIVTVTEEYVSKAIYKLFERNKIVAEPSGAVGLAAIMEGKVDVKGKKVAIVVSGGNINPLLMSKIIYKELENLGQLVRIECTIPDRPGNLYRIAMAIAENGGNIYHAEVDNLRKETPPGFQSVTFTVNVRGQDHLDRIIGSLREMGYLFRIT